MSNRLKILVADDDPMMREALVSALRAEADLEHDPEIDLASNGRMARTKILDADFARKPYDIVFLDWEMPEIAGIDVLKYFRQQPHFKRTAFVMVTSVSEKEQVIDAVKSGATAYLIKPITLSMVSRKMAEIVKWLESNQKR